MSYNKTSLLIHQKPFKTLINYMLKQTLFLADFQDAATRRTSEPVVTR